MTDNQMTREEYIKEYRRLGEEVIFKEELPFVSDILDYALGKKPTDKLKHVFDALDNEEGFHNQIARGSTHFSEDESAEFIDTVIAANVSDIRDAGTFYKLLMFSGDDLRIRGKNCGSFGRKIELPVSEEDFLYNIRDSYVYFEDKKDLTKFSSYEEFEKDAKGHDAVYVRSPMTCKHRNTRGICKTCAGSLPEGTQNIGAFSTLMVTEFATQSALSSMNKGTKDNVNSLLTAGHKGVKTWDDFDEWADDLLERLKGKEVERRFYEIILIGRARPFDGDDERVIMSSLSNPKTKDLFGSFIFRPKESAYRRLLAAGSFEDDSLKLQIAMNQYRKGAL